ncbi:MAG TPA: hypothetical protein VGI81_15850 [Tepidisphaeraceae bacterium]|jgi:hypothetical protein
MFILIPTCDAYASIASISLTLVQRYWPDHPIAHVLHHAVVPRIGSGDRVEPHDCGTDASSWVGNIARFLERRTDELFLFMLDDYGLYAPVQNETIATAVRLMEADRRVGIFALSWYPARERVARDGWPGVETLAGVPILLQAAIWRRDAFLDLARSMDPRTSPHGFERLATQRARGRGIEVCGARLAAPKWVGGHFLDGLDKRDWPLPYHNLMHAGRLDPRHEPFLRAEGLAPPPQGLGDTVERIARATGIAKMAKRVSDATGRDCGCDRRRQTLNRWVPYKTE